jgi:hypothetical protein
MLHENDYELGILVTKEPIPTQDFYSLEGMSDLMCFVYVIIDCFG